jgi:hypothetical protein
MVARVRFCEGARRPPNYASEARVYAKYILGNMPDSKIAILWQNDDLGRDYLAVSSRGWETRPTG